MPVHAPDDSPIHLIATDLKLIDGPKVNDLVLTPGFFIAVLVILAAVFFMHKTRMGRTVYAIGGLGPGDLAQARWHGAQGIAAIRALWPLA